MEKDDLSTHISHAFNEDLTRIRGLTLEMGHTVEEQIGLAVQALLTGDARLGRRVEVDDSRVNELEVTIDGECSQVDRKSTRLNSSHH